MKQFGKHIIWLFALFIFCSAFTSTGRIGWQEQRPLQWSDYQGTPDYEDGFRDAVTASALKFTTRCKKDGTFETLVSAEFVKDQSWVKEVAQTDYHLGHERLHFDITELYARKFRQFVKDQNFTCEDRDLVQKYVYQYLEDCMNLQNQYDKETRHSMHHANQAKWEAMIDAQLNELSEFASK